MEGFIKHPQVAANAGLVSKSFGVYLEQYWVKDWSQFTESNLQNSLQTLESKLSPWHNCFIPWWHTFEGSLQLVTHLFVRELSTGHRLQYEVNNLLVLSSGTRAVQAAFDSYMGLRVWGSYWEQDQGFALNSSKGRGKLENKKDGLVPEGSTSKLEFTTLASNQSPPL